MSREIHKEWSCEVPFTPEETWRTMGDTDALNRISDQGFRFINEASKGAAKWRGEMPWLGQTISWEEHPFQFKAPEYSRQHRAFSGGPLRTLTMELTIQPTAAGSFVTVGFTFVPRFAWTSALINLQITQRTWPALVAALTALSQSINKPRYAALPAHRVLSAQQEHSLDQAFSTLSPPLRHALTLLIRSPSPEADRIRPLQLAHNHNLDPNDTILGILSAVRSGDLELRYELICPSCRGPQRSLSSLSLGGVEVHCPSCDVVFDGSFPDSVEVVFRASSALRDQGTKPACLLSPANTPHVLCHEQLAAQTTREWIFSLQPGGYRLDATSSHGGAAIEVRDDLRASRITLDIHPNGVSPTILRVGPGEVTIVVRNRLDRPTSIKLQRRNRPPHTLTAGRLLELPDAKDLLPPEAIAPNLKVTVASYWVVMVSDPTSYTGTGAWLVEEDEHSSSVKLFEAPVEVVEYLRSLHANRYAVGVSHGPVAVLQEKGISAPVGEVVDLAIELSQQVSAGRVAVSSSASHSVTEHLCSGEEILSSTPDFVVFKITQAPAPPPEPSLVIDGYELLDERARGGMGRVINAINQRGDPVVVKVLLPEYAQDPDHRQRFFNEAYLTHTLNHPNIVTVFDYGTTQDGSVYLVMETLEGDELSSLLRHQTLSPARTVEIGESILSALTVAHQAGVVHRDIKPENVFVQPDGAIKVIDFGIAHPMDQIDTLAARGLILGSPKYMSPEQVAREPVDGRSDLYSTAIVLYEALTGAAPFTGSGPLEIARARLHTTAVPLQDQTDIRIPTALQDVIMGALQRDPTQRPEDADHMKRALHDAVEHGHPQ